MGGLGEEGRSTPGNKRVGCNNGCSGLCYRLCYTLSPSNGRGSSTYVRSSSAPKSGIFLTVTPPTVHPFR